MSIPQITYGNGGPYVDGVDEVLTPQIIYFPPGENNHWSLRSSGSAMPIPVNASSSSDPTTDLELITLSNGCRLILTYRLYVTDYTGGITYHFSWVMKLLDENDSVIRQNGGSRDINKGSSDPNDPFLEAHMNGGVVSYGTNRPTTLNEEAIQYFPLCAIYTKRPNQLIPEPFSGDSRTNTFEATWVRECYLSPIGGETEYDRFIDDLVAGGDGSDPVTPDEPDPKPPAGGGDTSEPGGGKGSYDDDSDPIDFPDVPANGALDSGAVIAHRVATNTLTALMAKLWSNSIFDITNMWQKSIDNPMNAIVSLHALPVTPAVAQDPLSLFIGNFDTELNPPKVTSQYVVVDCGSLTIKEFWGSALDYSPYTKVEIFLPFIGIKKLQIEDVMKKTIHVKYYVDVLTGDCMAFIKCGQSVLYHYSGNCKMQIPLAAQTTDAMQNTIAATSRVAVAAAAGGAVGGPAGVIGSGALAISAANSVASSKISTERQGNLGGAVSLMDDFVPYLIIHRPQQSLASEYNKFKGYPSNITAELGSLTGYTEVEHINLSVPGANDTELAEIEALLKEGVII